MSLLTRGKQLITNKVQGGVLQLALGISLVIAILCSAVILLSYYYRLADKKNETEFTLQQNVYSALEYLKAFRSEIPFNQKTTLDLFNEGTDSVALVRRPWGLYEVAGIRAFHNKLLCERYALLAAEPDSIGSSAICMPGGYGSLQIVGKTKISGNVYVPQGGVSPGFIEGTGFEGNKLVDGKVTKISRSFFPAFDTTGLYFFKTLLSGVVADNDDMVTSIDLSRKSFAFDLDRVGLFYTAEPLVLSDTIRGNVIICSSQNIFISSDAVLEDVVVMAPDIVIEGRFKGVAQFIATHTIDVGDSAVLSYPSGLALIGGSADSLIHIGKSSIVEGVIAIPGHGTSLSSRGKILIDEKAIVKGFIYCNGNAEVLGSIFGHISAARFEARGNGNMIVDGVISSDSKPGHLPASLLWGASRNFKVARWLN